MTWVGQCAVRCRTGAKGHDQVTPRNRDIGAQAIHVHPLLERIRENPEQAELLIPNAEYTRCEIELAARREMIIKLEDFMRRRSKIELVVRKRDILDAEAGLREACEILFPEDAEVRLQEYLAELREEVAVDQQVA